MGFPSKQQQFLGHVLGYFFTHAGNGCVDGAAG
jgi:hypothetical protein